MWKKIVGIFICILFIGMSLIPIISGNINNHKNVNYEDILDDSSLSDPDQLDQSQTLMQGDLLVVNAAFNPGQEFKPTFSVLTRVELYIAADVYLPTDGITCSIRKTKEGSDITSVTIPPFLGNGAWIEFDFPDISVIPDDSYWIYLQSDSILPFHYYSWYMFESGDPYPNGDLYIHWVLNNYWALKNADATFKTYGAGNRLPNTPSSPNPMNHATGIDINADVSWTGGDPDVDDTVTYDVYFFSNPLLPQKVANNITTTTFDPGILANGLTYFWFIVAFDKHGFFAISPIWLFTTTNVINNPPNKPLINGPNTGKPGSVYSCSFIAIDPEGDNISYEIDWGDGIVIPWDGPIKSNEKISRTHVYLDAGDFTIMGRAKDIYGNIGDWGTLTVTMPKNKAISTSLFLQKIFQRFPLFEKILNQYL